MEDLFSEQNGCIEYKNKLDQIKASQVDEQKHQSVEWTYERDLITCTNDQNAMTL